MNVKAYPRSMYQPRRLVLLLFILLGLAGCDACSPWPKCSNDKHCRADKTDNPNKKTFYCVNKQCQECRTSLDCPDQTYKCDGYKCEKKTCEDVFCADGKRCDPTTLTCKYVCEQDGETPCDGDQCKVCKSHQCVPKPPACASDTDCPGDGKICKNPGTCEAICDSGCSSAKPCPPGNRCENGQCVKASCEPETIYYDFNRSFVRDDAKSALRRNLACFNQMKDRKILIEGHCDERGSREFNIQLGKRRARAAKSFVSNLGISSSRICTISKGKEEPAVSDADTEDQHQRNRRAIFRFVETCP